MNQAISVFEYTEVDEIIITFTDQNGRPLEIEEKANLKLHIDKQKCNNIL